ncbi:ABC transporter permease [Salinispora arenicola]|uniref:ABC transporter permease n=1 Tax=Salinispora arenicola TaxID=168697 RepID=UPI00035FC85D|nr:ABC transporter permease subunit [Salinispora arenicola]NIL59388.1 ABC transporter permease subunit [Salinispora arenicola]NIL60902.1 ABC transporter permease subunit [Salinispora arenicola]
MVLIWSRSARWPVWALFAAVFLVIVVAPLAVLVAAALAAEWNDVLPGAFTTAHLGAALTGENQASLLVSLQTAAVAGLAAVAVGTWAALALAVAPRWLRRGADALLHLPVAIPSVVVGLGLLVAYSRPPLLLNGTRWIVLIAHVVLVLAFSYATVSSALTRIDGSYAQVAASLGAPPALVLWRVRLPMLLPAMSAAAALAIALSMGEVGATIMVYPPDWRTLPVTVFTLTDRGRTFDAAAATLILLGTTLVALLVLGRISRGRAAAGGSP